MSIPQVLFAGRLTHKARESGAHTFTFGESDDVLLIFNRKTVETLVQFKGRNIEILVHDIEPPSVWTTEEQVS